MKKTTKWETKLEEILTVLIASGGSRYNNIGTVIDFVKKERFEAYKQGIKDEIECVEKSGEHLDLQEKLKITEEWEIDFDKEFWHGGLVSSPKSNGEFTKDVYGKVKDHIRNLLKKHTQEKMSDDERAMRGWELYKKLNNLNPKYKTIKITNQTPTKLKTK